MERRTWQYNLDFQLVLRQLELRTVRVWYMTDRVVYDRKGYRVRISRMMGQGRSYLFRGFDGAWDVAATQEAPAEFQPMEFGVGQIDFLFA